MLIKEVRKVKLLLAKRCMLLDWRFLNVMPVN